VSSRSKLSFQNRSNPPTHLWTGRSPRASKHLRVLREVGLVRVRGAGKQRLYDLDARGLRPVHEWVGGFERFWNESFDRLDTYVQDLKQTRQEE
jgi:hypothetical protein